ncbi:hypothetical protein T439DRAFT_328746 [Meredithblackwellia eburnea MCA 4105]
MVRNAGKLGKIKRGGGRHFSRDISRLDNDGRPERPDESSDEDSDDDSDEEEDERPQAGALPPSGSEDEDDEVNAGLTKNVNQSLSLEPSSSNAPATVQRTGAKLTAEQIAEARKAKKAAKGKGAKPAKKGSDDSDEESEAEENANQKQNKNMKVSDLGAPREMSRREREQAEKKAAQERYQKLHAAGKTDEAKSDLSRLAEIRKQREQAAARRLAETDAKDAANKAALEASGKAPRRAPGVGRRVR